MTDDLFIRHLAEFAIVFPAALFAMLPVRRHTRWQPAAIFLLSGGLLTAYALIGAFFCTNTGLPTNYFLLPSFPLLFIPYDLAFRLDRPRKLYCFLMGTALSAFCTMYGTFLSAPIEASNTQDVFLLGSGLACLAVAIPVGIIFLHAMIKEMPDLLEEPLLKDLWKYLLLLPFLLLLLFLWMTPRNSSLILVGRIRPVSLVLMLLFPIVMSASDYAFWKIIERIREAIHLQQEKELFSMEKKRYEQLRAYTQETRAIRHNFRHHLIVIEELARNGNMDRLLEYLKQFQDSPDTVPPRFCDNFAADAVAGRYYLMARQEQIDITWQLDLPEELPIREADYCTIMGNLLENAIRAAAGLPPEQRRITATARMLTEELLGISVTNPYRGAIRFDKEGLPKAEKSGHGIGLKSVAAIVRRYNGTFETKAEKGTFTANVLLYK